MYIWPLLMVRTQLQNVLLPGGKRKAFHDAIFAKKQRFKKLVSTPRATI